MIYDYNGNAIAKDSPIELVRHRGEWYGHSGIEENSLAAIKKAHEVGFRWVEVDVRYSSDNVPVLAHDATYKSATVESTTCSALAALGITDLETVFRYAKKVGLHLILDIKAENASGTAATIRLIKQYSMAANVVVMPLIGDSTAYHNAFGEQLTIAFVGLPLYDASATQPYRDFCSTHKNTYGDMNAAASIDKELLLTHAKGILLWNINHSNIGQYLPDYPPLLTLADSYPAEQAFADLAAFMAG